MSRLFKSLAWKCLPGAELQLRTQAGLRLEIRDKGAWAALEEIFVARIYEPFFRHLNGITGWVDLGCNVGFFSLGLLDYLKRQHAADPLPRALLGDANTHCVAMARRMVQTNRLASVWDCRHVVVGPPGEVVTFSQFKLSLHSGIFSPQRGEKTFRYRTTDLPALLSGWDGACNLIKLDIEGAERCVFENHSELMAGFQYGLCEWHAPHFLGSSLREWIRNHKLELLEMKSQPVEGYDSSLGDSWDSPVGTALWRNPGELRG